MFLFSRRNTPTSCIGRSVFLYHDDKHFHLSINTLTFGFQKLITWMINFLQVAPYIDQIRANVKQGRGSNN